MALPPSDSHDAVKQAHGRHRINSISMPTEPTDSSPARPQLDSWRFLAYWKKRWVAINLAVAAIAVFLGNLEKIIDDAKKAYSFVIPSVEISPGTIGSDNNAMLNLFS